MIQLHFKRLFRNKGLFTLLLVYICGVVYWFLYRESGYDVYFQGGLDIMIQVLPYMFLVVLFISYEVFSQLNRTDTMELISNRRICLKDQKYDLFILSIIVIFSGVVVWVSLRKHALALGYREKELDLYFARVAILFVIMSEMIAVMAGWCISAIKNRIISICSLLAVFYVFDTSFHQIIVGIDINSESFFKFGTLFTIFDTQKEGAITDNYYLMSVENTHFFRALFWLFLFCTILLAIDKKIIISLGSGVIAAVFLYLFFQPSGASYALDVSNGFDRWKGEQYYYTQVKQDEAKQKYIEAEQNEFSVLSYDIDLSVQKDTLAITAGVIVNQDSLDSYPFTLYHRYQIKKVFDQDGRTLKFDQDGDYVEVKTENQKIKKIYFVYEGFSQYYYATRQGICLPANYEYYPVAGWKRVFINDERNTRFTQELTSDRVDYKVKITCPKSLHVYTNLEFEGEEEKGKEKTVSYGGRTDGVTVVASPYLRDANIDGIRVVYSYIDIDNSPENKMRLKQYQEFFECYTFPAGTTYFAMPEENYSNVCFGCNQIIDQIYKTGEDFVLFQKQGNTYQLEGDDDAKQEAIDLLGGTENGK